MSVLQRTTRTARAGHTGVPATATMTTTRSRGQQDGATGTTRPGRARPGHPTTTHARTPSPAHPGTAAAGAWRAQQAAQHHGHRSTHRLLPGVTSGQRGAQRPPATLTPTRTTPTSESGQFTMTMHHTHRRLLNEQDPDTLPVASAHLIRSEESNSQRINRIGILLDNQSSMSSIAWPIGPHIARYRRHVMCLITNGSAGPGANIGRSEDLNSRPATPAAAGPMRPACASVRLVDGRVVA